MNIGRFYRVIAGVFLGVGLWGSSVCAGTIYDSPYVSFSPDRQAWTTDLGDQNVEWYPEGGLADVVTGVEGTLGQLQAGEHYYDIKRCGHVPIQRWEVVLRRVNCCHNAYPAGDEYHGIEFVRQPCFKPHFSAWRPICADCGRVLARTNFYMSDNAAASIDYLEMGVGLDYYYLCPFNNNLEMGTGLGPHICQDISANRYRVVYHANAGGEDYSGYMAPSFHMYNNAETYEGNPVTPRTHLEKNTYGRIGWEFVGWNTAVDGSGQFYKDGEEILNLSEEDYRQNASAGTVVLYAMWRPSESILEVDANGGSYCKNPGITEIKGSYGTKAGIDTTDIECPVGPVVSFECCGGQPLDSLQSTMYFSEWQQSLPFEGRLLGDTYSFDGPDGNRDRITAIYGVNPIQLPLPYKENQSFGGWYYDLEYEKKAGDAGEEYIPDKTVTLYAQWVELVLESEENYEAYQGAGAVDLKWQQEDDKEKSYKLFQCIAGQDWRQIYQADDSQTLQNFQKEFFCSKSEVRFAVPFTGFYHIDAFGAQGGNYGAYAGGKGGAVKGSFWLEQGQEITVCVGGQKGYHGGGSFTKYTWGGGYTSVHVGKELLFIAGGGGGASAVGNGGAGGLNTSLVASGHDGEKGGAGGGGGYLGGRAGEMQVHHHVKGVCNHVHQGNPNVKGGCYTKEVLCRQELEHVYTRSDWWYWGGDDEIYCPNCGADARKGETCIGHETEHYRHICPIHGRQESNTCDDSPSICEQLTGYALSCGRNENYTCGYPYDGYVISAKPSYGGSSYVNTKYTSDYSMSPGVRSGDGYVLIYAENIGFQTNTSLKQVAALDKASPRAIDYEKVQKLPLEENQILVQWEQPQDLGTVYYHKAQSFLKGQSQLLSESNITADTIVSGISGYLYIVDEWADTEVDWSNGVFLRNATETGELQIKLNNKCQYLHILATDYAKNCGKTVHIPLGGLDVGSIGVQWPLFTEPLSIELTENVCPGSEEETYYVKADGKTAFRLQYMAYLQGIASRDYQVNHAILESDCENGDVIRTTIHVPFGDLEQEEEFPAEKLSFRADGGSNLQSGDYVLATRSEEGRVLKVEQEWIPTSAFHGQKVHLIPVAGAETGEQIIYSDYHLDVQNGLWIIGDGQAPVISGLEVLQTLPLIDRRQQSICLELTATDELSGVRDFYLEIENLDNSAKATYRPDGDGIIRVDICSDIPIFSGDFMVSACAVDRVGNETVINYGTTEFDLQVSVERILEPHAPIFKCGESGYLNISSWGYAERIEVEFPEAFTSINPELNQVYVYDLKGAYMQTEQVCFMVPLEVPYGSDYSITVRAYKGDKMLEHHPALAVVGVSGTILDELRTRLR